jgi:hypothetical protein
MAPLTRTIQGLILFSTLLGVVFLWQAYPLLPIIAFGAVAFGWVLFVVDSVLTFVRPRISFYLGLVLALAALAETLSQPEHFGLVTSGNILAAFTIVAGSVAEALLAILVVVYVIGERKQDPWAWPGGGSQD